MEKLWKRRKWLLVTFPCSFVRPKSCQGAYERHHSRCHPAPETSWHTLQPTWVAAPRGQQESSWVKPFTCFSPSPKSHTACPRLKHLFWVVCSWQGRVGEISRRDLQAVIRGHAPPAHPPHFIQEGLKPHIQLQQFVPDLADLASCMAR